MTRNTASAAAHFPCRRADVPFKEFSAVDGMLLDLESGEYWGLEGAALAIWKLLDGRNSANDVAERIARTFDVETEQVARDLKPFLQQLKTAGLLASPGSVDKDLVRGAGAGRSRKPPKGTPYRPARLARRGNLKYLGQLD